MPPVATSTSADGTVPPAHGLSRRQAADRLRRHGPNRLPGAVRPSLLKSAAARLLNPLVLVLLCASLASALTGDAASFGFVAVVVLMSVALDMLQEHRAGRAVDALGQAVALRVRVRRDGREQAVDATRVVPGDVLLLRAGDVVPADGRVLAGTDLFVDQSALTGETWPVEKRPDGPAPDAALRMGSNVVGGSGEMQVERTGAATELGRLAQAIAADPPPTAFERGTRRFGVMLTRVTMALVLFVLLVNTLAARPLLESFLFAVALAVGLTPELLPMIVSVTLARGALRMARLKVIVKRLSAVQDLGAMDVLCTDKTGTLTLACPRVEHALDAQGAPAPRVFELAWLNSHFGAGLGSALDDALLHHATPGEGGWHKQGELPFDFQRRRASVLLAAAQRRLLVVKGAPEDVLRECAFVAAAGGPLPLDDAARERLARQFEAEGAQGLRLLAVAVRELEPARAAPLAVADERGLVFEGWVAFADPPKPTAPAALRSLAEHGVALKIVTGDTEAVTRHLCGQLGVVVDGVVTGTQIAAMDEAALRAAAVRANLFCRTNPQQKQRVVRALQAGGHVVGYLGDGINDAPPLHAADVGISVDSAVDVAKQAADLVLMAHDLDVLRDGIREGRRSFLNVDKYVRMATSSNFGNMASMAAAALFLPFLPMLPLQILLNNFLYDLSELPIPTDRVDDADLLLPQRWDAARVRGFMFRFGALSSVFDLLAFGLLYGVMHVPAAVFQSAWFVQSMATQALVIFLIRTPRAAWRDRPSGWLVLTSLAVVALAAALPFSPWAAFFGFVALPGEVLLAMGGLTLGYLATVETAKRLFRPRTA